MDFCILYLNLRNDVGLRIGAGLFFRIDVKILIFHLNWLDLLLSILCEILGYCFKLTY